MAAALPHSLVVQDRVQVKLFSVKKKLRDWLPVRLCLWMRLQEIEDCVSPACLLHWQVRFCQNRVYLYNMREWSSHQLRVH